MRGRRGLSLSCGLKICLPLPSKLGQLLSGVLLPFTLCVHTSVQMGRNDERCWLAVAVLLPEAAVVAVVVAAAAVSSYYSFCPIFLHYFVLHSLPHFFLRFCLGLQKNYWVEIAFKMITSKGERETKSTQENLPRSRVTAFSWVSFIWNQ